MRTHFIIFCLLVGYSINGVSQTINNKNYYQFQKNGGSINWLRSCDAIPIIIDELLKNGIAYHTIRVGKLLKIDDSTRLVVTISFEQKDKEYGFLYEASHGIPLNVKDRDFLTNQNKSNYLQLETDTKGNSNFMRIDQLPNNILLLKQTCYWFQFDNNGTQFPVSKGIAQSILRQDINDYLSRLQTNSD